MTTNKTPTVKEVKAGLKEMAMLKALPISIKKSKGAKRKGDTLIIGAPSDLGTCVATIFFTKAGNFIEACVCEPGRWAHCIAEDLTENQAVHESMRWVDTMEDVQKFLKREPYDWDGKKKWLKAIKRL